MTSSAFDLELVILIGVVVGLAGCIWSLGSSRRPYDQIGRGPLALDVPDRVPTAPLESAAGRAEVGQLVEAIAAARRARGATPPDLDAEVAALLEEAEDAR